MAFVLELTYPKYPRYLTDFFKESEVLTKNNTMLFGLILGIITGNILTLFLLWYIKRNKKRNYEAWRNMSMRLGKDLYTLRKMIEFKKFYNKWYEIRNLIPFLEVESIKMYRMSLIMDEAIVYLNLKMQEHE